MMERPPVFVGRAGGEEDAEARAGAGRRPQAADAAGFGEKLVGRGREKLAGDGLCGRDASKMSLAKEEDPEISGPVLCDLSTGEGLL